MAHWREHLGSPLLGAYSLYDDQTDDFKEVNGIITKTGHADYVLGESGKQKCFIAYTDMGKPMKLNVKMASVLADITGSRNPDKWQNIPVTFYVDKNVKSKAGTTEAIRIKAQRKVQQNFDAEKAKLNECKTLAELQTVYLGLSKDAQFATLAIKDQLKTKLA